MQKEKMSLDIFVVKYGWCKIYAAVSVYSVFIIRLASCSSAGKYVQFTLLLFFDFQGERQTFLSCMTFDVETLRQCRETRAPKLTL